MPTGWLGFLSWDPKSLSPLSMAISAEGLCSAPLSPLHSEPFLLTACCPPAPCSSQLKKQSGLRPRAWARRQAELKQGGGGGAGRSLRGLVSLNLALSSPSLSFPTRKMTNDGLYDPFQFHIL